MQNKSVIERVSSKIPKPDFDKVFPVIPLQKFLMFQYLGIRLSFDRTVTLNAFKQFEESNGFVICTLQKNTEDEFPKEDELHTVGILAFIKGTSGSPRNLLQVNLFGFIPVNILKFYSVGNNEKEQYFTALAKPRFIDFNNKKLAKRFADNLLISMEQYALHQRNLPDNLKSILSSLPPQERCITAHSFLKISNEEHQSILESSSFEEMYSKIEQAIESSNEVNKIIALNQQNIEMKMQRYNKEVLLQEQISGLQKELEEISINNPENDGYSKKIKEKVFPENIKEKLDEEMAKLKLLSPMNQEYSLVRNYIDWLLSIPFGIYTDDILDIKKAESNLNAKHFGLEKVKERILEHIAVLQLAQKTTNKYIKSPILCLVGPPGVGKTTLAMSIANTMNRNLARISLGGVHDDSEIRGHRRTYLGSIPGRIIQALKKAKSMNPLILLDEIDKMTSSFRGDPASAILEVLDPEINAEFYDHFMEVGIDLSRVFFLATANTPDGIPPALYDRLEIVRIPGYLHFEKEYIARDFLIPKILKQNSLSSKQLNINKTAIDGILREYTREAGVRELERKLETIARKRVMEIVSDNKNNSIISSKNLSNYLGVPDYATPRIVDEKRYGVTTGLAWTPVGGDILHIECLLLPGKGKLQLTGQLGDVMKESAQIALSIVREKAKKYKISEEKFRRSDIHLHFPDGAIPKDGPSAGIAITVAMLSAFTEKIISPFIAFTGEISLMGRLIAIGGLKEKSLAALDSGVKKIFLPKDNQKNVEDLPNIIKNGLEINFFSHINDVIAELF